MHPESGNSNVVSTLCFGVQWDAALKFISKVDSTYATDSTGKGWYSDNYSDGNVDHKTGIDIGTNASNKLMNIYDMAGNMWEVTMEAYSRTSRVDRGGGYSTKGSLNPASLRDDFSPHYTYSAHGFRLALYIK